MLAGEHITDEARAAAPGVADGVKAAGRLPVYFRGLSFWSRLTVFCRRIFDDVFL